KRAFPKWRDTPPQKRAQIFFRYKQLLERDRERIARAITTEHGKTLSDALGELQRGIEVVDYACGIPELLKGEYAKNVGPAIDCWSEFQPLGVVAGVTPFNFPAMVPMWMFPMAIACGNAFILKPSERDPTAPLILAELLTEAGLPDGLFNVLNGDRAVVEGILDHPDIAAVSFVGSTPVAKSIYARGTAAGKRVQALGGAKNHAVVLPDADLDNVVEALMGAAFGSAGERCMAISVAVCVGDEVADNLVAKLKDKADDIRVGPGDDESTEMGPVITQQHADRVSEFVASGKEDGANLVLDGRELVTTAGYFIGPTIIDHVKPDMKVYREEIFGPVLCVVRVNDFDEAMRLVDEHRYGNGACLFTQNGEAARHFTDNVKIGMVGVNVPLPVPAAIHSFGGWKESLFGDLYAYGPDSVRFYTRRKTITQRWPSRSVREAASFSFPSSSASPSE
ncbi:MAG: CoA-acylating methylmalonate-semialdehyde dehydrogenase, partial [Pseudomonadota bacterium]